MTTDTCACGIRPCLMHYDQLPPHGKRDAQRAAGVKGSWLAADGRSAREARHG
ncbi:hypothetical protein [Streptomyces griseorubiginosus]|uniref:hypothetical protein n=1 Tax=Streptomyces griseorubiginosus TaxID=67304 RepID=UPI000B328446|nr:hypothetical protein [Streptomyces griseorubiginosus]